MTIHSGLDPDAFANLRAPDGNDVEFRTLDWPRAVRFRLAGAAMMLAGIVFGGWLMTVGQMVAGVLVFVVGIGGGLVVSVGVVVNYCDEFEALRMQPDGFQSDLHGSVIAAEMKSYRINYNFDAGRYVSDGYPRIRIFCETRVIQYVLPHMYVRLGEAWIPTGEFVHRFEAQLAHWIASRGAEAEGGVPAASSPELPADHA